jgi:mannose-1-phosphate guanylyltransferase
MQRDVHRKHRWGVILAGGEGKRLRSLTRLVTGDDRPKQFCPLLGGTTLLAQTRKRIARSVSSDRTMFVLLRSQERFYSTELEDVPPLQMVVQPGNRGTLPAILCSLIRVARLDDQAVVAFFPSDHHYSEEGKFLDGLDLAFRMAQASPETVILLGAAATRAEAGYGWIEAGAAVSTHSSSGLLRVKRFWEKPSPDVAGFLLDRGCVWNTFVMVGRALAFLDMIQSGAPDVYQAFEPVLARKAGFHEGTMKAIYSGLASTDFSKVVLSAAPENLGVLCIGDVGWSDLGDPNRVITMLSETGVEREWVTLWRRGAAAASAA